MKKYQYLASWDDQTLTRVGEPVVVLGDSNVSQVEVTLPSNFLLDPTGAVARMYFLLPGEKESGFETLETATKDENGDSHVTWTIKHVHSQKGGRLAFSLTLIGDDAQWDSRTAIIPVYESRYQPESEEAEKPYTGRLDALEGSMASIRGEFAEVQEDFEDLKETATLGTPIPESLVANMTEGRVYIYTGAEPGYTAGHVYYYVDGVLKDGGVYGGTAVDATLTKSGQAADAKVTGDKIAEIKEDLNDITPVDGTLKMSGKPADAKKVGDELLELGTKINDVKDEIIRTAGEVEEIECDLTEEVKTALLACFTRVAWIGDDGQTYYDALSDALHRTRTISNISAVFNKGSNIVYDTDELYSLKQYLTVTATYSDGTTKEVNNYTLSGKLVAGTSTITVTYNKKTTTFNVTVTHQSKTLESISATFSSSAVITTDNVLDDLRPYLTVRATYADSTTSTIANYSLSGNLNVGTNTITVSYGGKTTTFTVNVTQAEATLQSISATFNQGSVVIYENSSLESLKPYLTVTARYSDSTTQTVTEYTLSGTLTAGTSTITASYGGKTATFNVTVSERVTPPTPSDPIYTVTPGTVFNGTSDYIDTGLQLMGSNKSNYTIVFDVLDKSSPVSGNNNMLFHCMHEASPWPGNCIQFLNAGSGKNLNFDMNSNTTNSRVGAYNIPKSTSGVREKFVGIIDFQSGTMKMVANIAGVNHVESKALPSDIGSTILTETALIGCYQVLTGTKGRFWKGTVYDFKIYNYAWSETEAQAYLQEDHS